MLSQRIKYSINFSILRRLNFYPSVPFCSLPTFPSRFHTYAMADTTELSDWELLQSDAPDSSSIKSEHLPPSKPVSSSSEEEEEATDEGGIDSDNPSSHGEIGSGTIHEEVSHGVECADPNSDLGEVEEPVEVRNEEGSEGVEEKNENLNKTRRALWEMPWEIVKYCLSKVKPVWFVSLAGAILGLALIGRRMHRIREKQKSASVRVSMDEKRGTKFAAHAVHVNEALKQVPILRTSPSAGGNTTWFGVL